MSKNSNRLQELKFLLKQEKASENPSKLYIDDLKLSIKEATLLIGKPEYEIVK